MSAQTAHAGATVPIGSGFSSPAGVAVDGHGNVFVGDVGDADNGTVSEIVAVNGVVSSSSVVNTIGSRFSDPFGVAVDGHGNVFVADSGNQAVYEIVAGTGGNAPGAVSSSSAVNPIGTGFTEPYGVAVDGYGNVFVANGAVYEVVAGTGGNAPGAVSSSSAVNTIGTGFGYAEGVAVDGYGNVFVADYGNSAVYEIVAGTGANAQGAVSSSSTVNSIGTGFTTPIGVAVDGYGNVFVADSGNSAIKEIVAGTGGNAPGAVSSSSTVNTIGTGFAHPSGVAVDGYGNVFVADYNHSAVKEILAGAQKFPATPVGSTSAPLTVYFTFDSSETLAATPYAVLTEGVQNLDFQAASSQNANVCATGVTYNPGNVCTVNVTFTPLGAIARTGAVQLMGSSGTPIATFFVGGVGTGPQLVYDTPVTPIALGGALSYPVGLALDGNDNIYVADNGGKVVEFAAGCTAAMYTASQCTVTQPGGGIGYSSSVAVDGAGNIYVSQWGPGLQIAMMPSNCVSSGCVTHIGGAMNYVSVLKVDGSGNLYVADQGDNAVRVIPAGCLSSSCMTTLGGGFTAPTDLAVDSSGNVFVVEYSGSDPLKEIPAGCTAAKYASSLCTVTTLASGIFNTPYEVGVDGGGDVYIFDKDNILKILPPGCASSACLIEVGGVLPGNGEIALDGSGNIFAPIGGAYPIVELNRATAPSISFPTPTTAGTTDGTDGAMPVLLQNIGNAQLNFSALSYPVDFPEESSAPATDCMNSTQLSLGGACTLSIDFSPLVSSVSGASTSLSESVSLTDNNLNAAKALQSVSVSGTALPATPTVAVGGVTTTYASTAGVTASASFSGIQDVAPSGAVSFSAATGTFSAASCKASGDTLSCTSTYTPSGTLAVNSYPSYITASITAAGGYTSASGTGTLTVNMANQATLKITGPSSLTEGTTATIIYTGGSGTGMVTFSSGSSTGCSVTGSTLSVTNPSGTCTITATKASDINYSQATSAPFTVKLCKANSVISITGHSPNPSVTGETVTVTFTVTPVKPASVTPTGSVSVTDLVGDSCTATVAAGSCKLAFPLPGPHVLVATYLGDSNYLGSITAQIPQVVEDFAIVAAPGVQQVLPGGKTTFAVGVTPVDGLSGAVSLACTGAPANSTCTTSPNPVNLSGTATKSATATITSTNKAAPGTYTLTFTGTYGSGNPSTGGLTRSVKVEFTIK